LNEWLLIIKVIQVEVTPSSFPVKSIRAPYTSKLDFIEWLIFSDASEDGGPYDVIDSFLKTK
jgi:hypothetical protein